MLEAAETAELSFIYCDLTHSLAGPGSIVLPRRVLRGLGVLWARFTAGRRGSNDVLDLVGRLVAKSLVVAEEDAGGSERYRFLETLRQYGRERLLAVGEIEPVHGRHATYYLALAEEVHRSRC